MAERGIQVLIMGSDKTQYELVYSSNFSLLSRNDFISVFFNEKLMGWALHISFIHDDAIKPLNTNFYVENNSIFITNNKWYGDSWLENPEPYYFSSKNKSTELFIKIRSRANQVQNIRKVEISVWKKLPKPPIQTKR